MRPRWQLAVLVRLAMGGLLVVGAAGCSAGNPQITAKAAFFSDEITGAQGKFVGAMPADENKLGADICRIFQITGTAPSVDLSWTRALDTLIALGYSDAEARQLMTDGTAAYCPAKSAAAAAASALAKAPVATPGPAASGAATG